jgi:hypothetical protein
VWYVAETFACPVCGLQLDSVGELAVAGMGTRMEIEGADPYEYESRVDEDSFDEAYRDRS